MRQNGLRVRTLVAILGLAASTVSIAATAPQTNEAAAEEAAMRSARENRQAAIQIQQKLRAEQQARKAAQHTDAKNERCIEGRRIKRVANGWVEAGQC